MPNIVCPECSTETFIDDKDSFLEGSPDEFCRNCDFPLFWAPADAVRTETAVAVDPPQVSPLRRLPGTEGLEMSTGIRCWNCGEMNDPEHPHDTCWRCGELLEPLEEEELPLEMATPLVTAIVPDAPHYWDPPAWLLVGLGVVLLALIVLVFVAVL